MQANEKQQARIAAMTFASIFPLYLAKVEKKGRTKEELMQIISWLTSFSVVEIESLIEEKVNFETFFERANLHPNASLIKGLICGYRVEEIEHELTRKVRYLDKIVDELAKGKSLEKIMR